MSFGTNSMTEMLPPEKIQIIIKVFSDLPYDILWKWDNAELPGRSKNIRINKWFPQSDLLSKYICLVLFSSTIFYVPISSHFSRSSHGF